jgi:hypothetical protein
MDLLKENKKLINLILTIFVLSFIAENTGCGHDSSVSVISVSPGHTLATAPLIYPGFSGTYLLEKGLDDYYKVNIRDDTAVTCTLSFAKGTLNLYILDSSGNILERSEGWTKKNTIIFKRGKKSTNPEGLPASGTYYFLVKGKENKYTMTLYGNIHL